MKKILPLILILFVFFIQLRAAHFLHLFPSKEKASFQTAIQWHSRWEEAYEKAKDEKKFLFVYFEKENSSWCDKMQKEIFQDPHFASEMRNDFIFLRLDVEKAEREASFFRAKEAPYVAVLDCQKGRFFPLGYLPVDAKKYAAEVKKDLLMNKKKGYVFAERNGRQREDVVVSVLDHSKEILLEEYAEKLFSSGRNSLSVMQKRKEIEDLDPQNHLYLHRQLAFLEFYDSAMKGQIEEAVVPLIEYIQLFAKSDKEHLWEIEMTMAQFFAERNDTKNALDHARAAYRLAPVVIKKELAAAMHYLKKRSSS